MPGREIPLISNLIYHVVNRGIASQPIFTDRHDYLRMLHTIIFYQNDQPPLRYSFFIRQTADKRENILSNLHKNRTLLVDVVSYCLMTNHVHLLLIQRLDNGISKFMSQIANSYTKYYNTKYNRKGPIFQGKFKAVRIATDEQLLHVSRYIHLNPYTSFVVKYLSQLETYPYSSLQEYLNLQSNGFCEKGIILNQFRNLATFKQFMFDQAEYQRKLDKIKHLTLDDEKRGKIPKVSI